MDSSLVTALVTSGGFGGLVVALIILRVLVPGWYAKELKDQNENLTRTAEKAVSELGLANQLVLELRSIAAQRAGSQPDLRVAAQREYRELGPTEGGSGAAPSLAPPSS